MLRAVLGFSILFATTSMLPANAEEAPRERTTVAEDCAPPKNFAKRFPKLREKKALRRVSKRTDYESLNPLKPDNPVTGASVDSNDLYAHRFLGNSRYGHDHTFASITRKLNGETIYSIRISDTQYTKGTRPLFFNEVAEIYVPIDGELITIPRTTSWTDGFCGPINPDQPRSCFNTATGSFEVGRDLFEKLATFDPKEQIVVPAKMKDGTMRRCPYYFAPLSFKAPLMTIDEAFAKAAEKDARNRAGEAG